MTWQGLATDFGAGGELSWTGGTEIPPPLAASSRVSPSRSAEVMGFCLKWGMLQPSGTSSTSCRMLTPGMGDFLRGFPGEGGGKGDGPQLSGALTPPPRGRAPFPLWDFLAGVAVVFQPCQCSPREVGRGCPGETRECPGRGVGEGRVGKALLRESEPTSGGSALCIQENMLKPKAGTKKAKRWVSPQML